MKAPLVNAAPRRAPVPLPYPGFIAGIAALALFCWLVLETAGGAA